MMEPEVNTVQDDPEIAVPPTPPTWVKTYKRSSGCCLILVVLLTVMSFKSLIIGLISGVLNPFNGVTLFIMFLGYYFVNNIAWETGKYRLGSASLIGYLIYLSCLVVFLVFIARESEVGFNRGNTIIPPQTIQMYVTAICASLLGIYALFRLLGARLAFFTSQCILFTFSWWIFLYCLKNLATGNQGYSMISPVTLSPMLMSLSAAVPFSTVPTIIATFAIMRTRSEAENTFSSTEGA